MDQFLQNNQQTVILATNYIMTSYIWTKILSLSWLWICLDKPFIHQGLKKKKKQNPQLITKSHLIYEHKNCAEAYKCWQIFK